MNIQTRNFHHNPQTIRRQSLGVANQESQPSDSVTLSTSKDRFSTTRKAIGGGVAAGLYAALLGSLPVAMIPAFGGTTALAGRVMVATIATAAVGGAFASATMPKGKNWY